MNATLPRGNPRMVHVLSALAIGLVVVQLLLLQHSDVAQFVDAIPAKVLFFVVFGAIAAFIWLTTETRWPLIAWAVFVLIAAIDQTQQGQPDGDDNPIAEAATGRAALPVLLR